jgi:prepilin-type N-terminal cleavage/methylation domain-containing protein
MGSLRRAPAEAGFTLIELTVALTLIVIGVFSTAQVFMGNLRTANVAAHRTDAYTLAVRDIETMRAIPYAQLGFSASVAGYSSTFVDGSTTYSTVTVPYSQTEPLPDPVTFRGMNFQLRRNIYWVDRNMASGTSYKKTTIFVDWTDQGGTHRVRQDAIIYPSGLGVAASTTTTTTPAGMPNAAALTSATVLNLPTSIDLNWTPGPSPPAVTSWKIQRSTDNFATAPSDLATVTGTVATYRASGLAPGTTYQFRVGALNGTTGPAWSNTVTAAIPAASGSACQILSETITPSTVTRNYQTHQLQSTPAVSVATTGSCTAMSLRYQPAGSALQVTTLTPNAASTSWTASVVASVPWDLGNHVIAVWDNVANLEFSGSSGITVNEGTPP